MVDKKLVIWQEGAPSINAAVIAMGVFDGVHEGHQFLLKRAAADANKHGLPLYVVTFATDPDELFQPADSLNKLMTNDVRLQTLVDFVTSIGCHEASGVLAIPFTRELASLAPNCFLDSILLQAFPPVVIHVGEDFCYGAQASGNVKQMRDWGAKHNCKVVGHHLLQDCGKPVTATRIRSLLAAGDVNLAATLLTRPYAVSANVVHGRNQGKELGYPTVNLAINSSLATVGDGVYAGYAIVAGQDNATENAAGNITNKTIGNTSDLNSLNGSVFRAAISVGVPQTFGDLPSTTEAFLLDFPADGCLYDTEVELRFVQRLRDMKRFDSPEELATTIANNVHWIRENLSANL